MKNALQLVLRWLGKIEMALAMGLTLMIVGIIVMQIVARYVFNAPVPWMEELAMIMFIYLTLMAAAIAARDKRHILVDLFPAGRVARTLGLLMSVLTIVILGLILKNIAPIMIVEMRRSTVSLPVNFPVAYYNTIPLAYCLGSIILSLVYDLLFERKDAQEALV